MARLHLNKVHKRYGNVTALHDVSLDLDDGEFLVLVGPSGCGKSTLMNMIAGLDEPSGGRISLDGRDITELAPAERDISMVFQSYALYPNMTVEQNIAFPLRMRKVARAERALRVQQVASTLQLGHLLGRKPRQLSGGQRQRVAIGRALAREPRLYLFDEPLSNLDAQLRLDMRTQIKRLHQSLRATIVYVTHDQIEAMTLATRIAVMKDGVVQQFGTPHEVYHRPANTFVAGFMGSPRMNLLRATVSAGDGGPWLQLGGGARLALPQAGAALSRRGTDAVIVGVRAEAVALLRDGAAPAARRAALQARVDVVEPTGADILAVLDVGGQELTARLDPEVSLHSGQIVAVCVDPGRVVLFDARSQQRLA